MSQWTHGICDECWEEREPGREPARLKPRVLDDCCFCGNMTRSGIYVRADPKTLEHCSQEHP